MPDSLSRSHYTDHLPHAMDSQDLNLTENINYSKCLSDSTSLAEKRLLKMRVHIEVSLVKYSTVCSSLFADSIFANFPIP